MNRWHSMINLVTNAQQCRVPEVPSRTLWLRIAFLWFYFIFFRKTTFVSGKHIFFWINENHLAHTPTKNLHEYKNRNALDGSTESVLLFPTLSPGRSQKVMCINTHLGALVNGGYGISNFRWALRFCISDMLPDGIPAAGFWIMHILGSKALEECF